jgi:lipoprotein-anchoring transpeptidase ErfK/SrfK
MRARTLLLMTAILLVCAAALPGAQTKRKPSQSPGKAHTAHATKSAPPSLPCGDLVAFAVLMDRQGFSPGQIDGTATPNFLRALTAFRAARNITATGNPDCDTWRALGGDDGDPAITDYVVTDEDVNGPYQQEIPAHISEQTKLPSLEYRSALEKLAERFHASPALLQKLNPGLTLSAGRAVKVPAVQPFNAQAKPTPDSNASDLAIDVSRGESALRVTRSDGTLAFFAPVTTGSQHDPLPPGQWQVKSVLWRPVFHYNPNLFWDAKPGDSRGTIKPGPNNPVGVVWIGLDLEHYGIHGTAEPERVGRTYSHGCVRLTNWDAARLATLVKAGTRVVFQ